MFLAILFFLFSPLSVKDNAPSVPLGRESDEKAPMATKLPVHVDREMETLSGIAFEACAAYFDDDEEVRVLGEAISANGKPIMDYREVQVVVYDADGDILGRGYTNWTSFQIRQSFEIEVFDLPGTPVRVRVFPSRED